MQKFLTFLPQRRRKFPPEAIDKERKAEYNVRGNTQRTRLWQEWTAFFVAYFSIDRLVMGLKLPSGIYI